MKLTVRISDDLYDELRFAAQRRGQSLSAVVRLALRFWLAKEAFREEQVRKLEEERSFDIRWA